MNLWDLVAAIAPELILAIGATDLLLLAAFSRNPNVLRTISISAVVLLLLAAASLLGPASSAGELFDGQFRAGLRILAAAAQGKLADFGNRRQRLAAKAERADAEQIVGVADFARGMAGHREREFLRWNPAAVVTDADQFETALLDGFDPFAHWAIDDIAALPGWRSS